MCKFTNFRGLKQHLIMPLVSIVKNNFGSLVGLWNMTESYDFLKTMLRRQGQYPLPPHYTHERRIKEWVTVRVLLHEMLPSNYFDIRYNDSGKPFLDSPSGHISISHTHGHVCVMYHPHLNCGVDVELIDERIDRVAKKFIRTDENAFLNSVKLREQLYVIWSAKEVVYKMYGKKSLDFKLNLRVQPFHLSNEGSVTAELILNNDICPYTVNYTIKNNLLLAFASE